MKFLYLADTHLGGSDDQGYRQQNRYLSHIQELISGLKNWLETMGDIDFILHGGDMVDVGNPANIRQAAELFGGLGCPVYLALGNHDLSEAESYVDWMRYAPGFFPGGSGNFQLTCDGVNMVVLSAHWGETPYRWFIDEPQIPYFDAAQLELLKDAADIIVSHAPPCGLPASQTGIDCELHPPKGDFLHRVGALARQARAKLVLGAHNHMNLHVERETTRLVTASAFTETPFEFKIIESDATGTIRMETVGLAAVMPFQTVYDFGKTYIQGRPCDRSF